MNDLFAEFSLRVRHHLRRDDNRPGWHRHRDCSDHTPNFFPMVFMFGLLGWIGTPLDIGTVMTASIALGDRRRRCDPFSDILQPRAGPRPLRQDAVHATYQQCGFAMFTSSMVCGLGPLVFVRERLSAHRAVRLDDATAAHGRSARRSGAAARVLSARSGSSSSGNIGGQQRTTAAKRMPGNYIVQPGGRIVPDRRGRPQRKTTRPPPPRAEQSCRWK